MNLPWKLSDAEYVARVERQLRWHRPIGFLMSLFSIFFIGCGLYFAHLLESGLFPMFDDQLGQTAFELGLVVGLFGGKILYFAGFCLLCGVYWFFAGRKDKLLVAYHQRLSELGELKPEVAL